MHQPVLIEAVTELLVVRPGGVYVDGTLGAGGHAEAILKKAGSHARLVGIDRDVEALARAESRLASWKSQCLFLHGNFADMTELLQRANVTSVDGILLDLGMSSDQVDAPARGFSFQRDGPLDMRMDLSQPLTAADIVNTWEQNQLADLIWTWGEESASRRIASEIVRQRRVKPIHTTVELADVVANAKGGRKGRIHPATKTFQALRMAVNKEMESLEQGLDAALRLVARGGRVAVISFHSMEDRMVKRKMAAHVGRVESLQEGGSRWIGERPTMRWITKKPRMPAADEVERNPRARSARLRVVERMD